MLWYMTVIHNEPPRFIWTCNVNIHADCFSCRETKNKENTTPSWADMLDEYEEQQDKIKQELDEYKKAKTRYASECSSDNSVSGELLVVNYNHLNFGVVLS